MADDAAAQAAADVVNDLVGDTAEAPFEEGEQPAVAEQTVEVEIPSWEADTSGLDFLDELEERLDEEPEPPSFTVDEEEPDWNEDEQTTKLKREHAKLQKQLAWEREQRLKVSSKGWKEEAARRFPLADVDEIQADSRRAFLRKAHEQHARYERKLKPFTDTLEALKQQAVAEVKQEARAQAEAAWGKPTAAPQVHQVEQADEAAKLDRRQYKSPYEMALARLKGGLQI